MYAQIKETIKAPLHWPLWKESIGDRWIPRTKGQWRGKCFHMVMSAYACAQERVILVFISWVLLFAAHHIICYTLHFIILTMETKSITDQLPRIINYGGSVNRGIVTSCKHILQRHLTNCPENVKHTRIIIMWVVNIMMSTMSSILEKLNGHYGDVIMGTIAFQITNLTIVYSTVYFGFRSKKHLGFCVRGIHRGPVNSTHKWPVTRKM